jgi:hypothetical protein
MDLKEAVEKGRFLTLQEKLDRQKKEDDNKQKEQE